MKLLNNIKIPIKIFVGFSIVIGLLIISAGIGTWSLNDANEDFARYRALARQTVATGRIQANLLMTRIHAKDFIIRKDETSIEHAHDRAQETLAMIGQAQPLTTGQDQLAIINASKTALERYIANFGRVTAAQRERNRIVLGDLAGTVPPPKNILWT
jgi:methyl-accepting chemotaxis protein